LDAKGCLQSVADHSSRDTFGTTVCRYSGYLLEILKGCWGYIAKMKLSLSSARAILGFAIALSSTCDAFAHERVHQHRHLDTDLEVRHSHNAPEETSLATRGGQCQFPTDDPNLVAVTPNAKNAGWAMSPDQECKPGSYCPFACKPGMVMAQWDPDSTYTYPASMVQHAP
jgi:hypothetical protein